MSDDQWEAWKIAHGIKPKVLTPTITEQVKALLTTVPFPDVWRVDAETYARMKIEGNAVLGSGRDLGEIATLLGVPVEVRR